MKLLVKSPDIQPKATEYIPEMIELIEDLISKDHAYEKDGHVLFHVPSYENYGKLSKRNRDEQIAGSRVEIAPFKRDPADFVLWKPSNDASQAGILHGVLEDRAGTQNVLLCQKKHWDYLLISMEVAEI